MNNSIKAYIDQMEESVAEALLSSKRPLFDSYVGDALTSGPHNALNQFLPIDYRRENGIFFTSSLLVRKVMNNIHNTDTTFFDPALGAGDLLLGSTKYLPIKKSLEETIELWGQKLAGYEIQSEFLRLTKIRLVMTALFRGKYSDIGQLRYSNQWFPLLKHGDFLATPKLPQKKSTILSNPPYQLVKSPDNCKWANGKVSTAAVFMHYCLLHAYPGSQIISILPDVLRSGTRYSKWREMVESKTQINNVELFGLFDSRTDIDVFILTLSTKKSKQTNKKWDKTVSRANTLKVGELFEVRVGPLVAYRDKEIGMEYPYLVARKLPAWKKITKIETRRKYSGTVYLPPFVVVRRTSRPGDTHRAIGTIISGSQPVAVENHLLILKPRDNKLKSCEALLSNLQKQETTSWLNHRIRCRHLTVASLKELPWWDDTE